MFFSAKVCWNASRVPAVAMDFRIIVVLTSGPSVGGAADPGIGQRDCRNVDKCRRRVVSAGAARITPVLKHLALTFIAGPGCWEGPAMTSVQCFSQSLAGCCWVVCHWAVRGGTG